MSRKKDFLWGECGGLNGEMTEKGDRDDTKEIFQNT